MTSISMFALAGIDHLGLNPVSQNFALLFNSAPLEVTGLAFLTAISAVVTLLSKLDDLLQRKKGMPQKLSSVVYALIIFSFMSGFALYCMVLLLLAGPFTDSMRSVLLMLASLAFLISLQNAFNSFFVVYRSIKYALFAPLLFIGGFLAAYTLAIALIINQNSSLIWIIVIIIGVSGIALDLSLRYAITRLFIKSDKRVRVADRMSILHACLITVIAIAAVSYFDTEISNSPGIISLRTPDDAKRNTYYVTEYNLALNPVHRTYGYDKDCNNVPLFRQESIYDSSCHLISTSIYYADGKPYLFASTELNGNTDVIEFLRNDIEGFEAAVYLDPELENIPTLTCESLPLHDGDKVWLCCALKQNHNNQTMMDYASLWANGTECIATYHIGRNNTGHQLNCDEYVSGKGFSYCLIPEYHNRVIVGIDEHVYANDTEKDAGTLYRENSSSIVLANGIRVPSVDISDSSKSIAEAALILYGDDSIAIPFGVGLMISFPDDNFKLCINQDWSDKLPESNQECYL